MPALRIFGRKWLFSSDDLVLPCIFEFCFRVVCLTFTAIVLQRYWLFLGSPLDSPASFQAKFQANYSLDNDVPASSINCTFQDKLFIEGYFLGSVALLSIVLVLLIALITQSAKGNIFDEAPRKLVVPLLYFKIFLILPEIGLNVLGTLWAFCDKIYCRNLSDTFSTTTIEVIIIFNWVIFALTVFGGFLVYDSLGGKKYRRARDDNDNNDTGPNESTLHKKLSKVWNRRFKWACCWLQRDEYSAQAFTEVAGLLSVLFRGTDLVPSDLLAGSILQRVRQKRESRELKHIRRIQIDDTPRYSTDLSKVFATTPSWMNLKSAHHFLRFALASYGWPMVCYIKCCAGGLQLIKKSTCCPCFRSKSQNIHNDNCCLCHTAGVRYMSRLKNEDILFASFKNQVFELPFCVLADHNTKSIVLTVRGSMSFRDVFTDLAASSNDFSAIGMPEGSSAHSGMIVGCDQILAQLADGNLLERITNEFPDYSLILTGHSLGAGVVCLLGAKLRSKYPDLKVYAFATPAGLLSREAARVTEQFVFTVGVGDDFVMRLSVDSSENLRVKMMETLKACKLPKYRVMLNGCGYTMFGIPSQDLERTWHDVTDLATPVREYPGSEDRPIAIITSEAGLLSNDFSTRRFSRAKLYTGGRILHIVRRKKTELEKKTVSPTFEMRWSTPENFTELKIMPRMLYDHLPDKLFEVVTKILSEQKGIGSTLSVNKI